jgi:hypothetical protein
MTRVVLAAAMIVVPGAAEADGAPDFSGNALYQACTAEVIDGSAFCRGYVWGGFESVAELSRNWATVQPICMPPGVSASQMADMVIGYLHDHPAERHRPAISLVLEAMARGFPCK